MASTAMIGTSTSARPVGVGSSAPGDGEAAGDPGGVAATLGPGEDVAPGDAALADAVAVGSTLVGGGEATVNTHVPRSMWPSSPIAVQRIS
jgi:hypothetical protein